MSSADRLFLRPFTVDDEREALAAHEELEADDFEFLLEDRDGSWADYIARLDEISRGVNLAPDRVPADLLAAEVDGQLVGRSSIRHTIENHEFLSEFGGHIGYAVRPAFRKQGYATAILRLSLARARELGIEQALITCDDSNSGSAATIERCGGVFERITMFQDMPRRRYWVPTS